MEPADRADRKRRGAWYTPPAVVDLVVGQAVVPALAEAAGRGRLSPVRILDPACGDGRLLVAASRAAAGAARARPAALVSGDAALSAEFSGTGLESAGGAVAVELVGIELDPATVAQARRAVPEARLLLGDGREIDPGGGFDVVIGNPPYLGQLARITTRGGRSRLGGGPYADVAAEFLLRAVELARPDGGRVALVLPQSVLATRDTGPVRAAVRDRAAVAGLWWAGAKVFDAGIHVCVLILQRGRTQGPVRRWRGPEPTPWPDAPAAAVAGPTWAPLIADAAGVPPVDLAEDHGRLGDLATATAGFRQHFYGLVPFVSDDGAGPPLITTGLIDAARCAWGERPARFAKHRFAGPRVDLDALAAADPGLAAWAHQQLQPKVLVAAQTRVIEAVVDEVGAWIPSVPVVSVRPRRAEDLWLVAAVLLAPPVAAWAAGRHLGSGLGPTSLRLSATQLLHLPLPLRPWNTAADLLRDGDLEGSAVEMCRAYGLGAAESEPVLEWWRAAAETTMVASTAADGRDSAVWSPSSTP